MKSVIERLQVAVRCLEDAAVPGSTSTMVTIESGYLRGVARDLNNVITDLGGQPVQSMM